MKGMKNEFCKIDLTNDFQKIHEKLFSRKKQELVERDMWGRLSTLLIAVQMTWSFGDPIVFNVKQ